MKYALIVAAFWPGSYATTNVTVFETLEGCQAAGEALDGFTRLLDSDNWMCVEINDTPEQL